MIDPGLNVTFIEVDREEVNKQGCPAIPTEKIRTTGTLTFDGELMPEQIVQTERDLCEARNRAYEENCTPDFCKCLSFKLTFQGSVERRLSNGERRLGTDYSYSETTACRAGTCGNNNRVGGGGRKLNEQTEVPQFLIGPYRNFCVCAVKEGISFFRISNQGSVFGNLQWPKQAPS